MQAHQAAHYNAPDTPDADPFEGSGAEEDNGATLAKLREEAEALGLPTYGTKAQISKRIDGALDVDEPDDAD